MHYFPAYSPFVPGFVSSILPFLIIIMIWTTVLKGFALWHSARSSQKEWFVALLVLNTFGILEIVYLVWFRPSSPHARRSHASHHTPAHEPSVKA